MKDQVRRMAENDEPKCKNCKHWEPEQSIPGVGTCHLRADAYRAAFDLRGAPELMGYSATMAATLDLSLCSAWEPK